MLQIKNMLGGGKPEGMYAWKKNIEHANVQAITLPGYYDNGSASDKSKTSYIGNFSTTPVVYSSNTFSIDDDTGMFILTGNIREYTPSSSSSSNYFTIHKQYIMFGTTTGNCMWTGIASGCYGWLYWDSNNDYWLLNRYSQTGLAKVIALRAKGSSTTGATNVTLKSSGNIYYSNSIVTDTSGNISLSGTISSLAYSSSNVSIPAGKFFMIDSKSSDLAFFSSLNASYPTIVSPSYGRVEADSPNYDYIVINKSTVKKIVSFVVSDNSSDYPSDDWKDAYYYSQITGKESPFYGLSIIAEGEVCPTGYFSKLATVATNSKPMGMLIFCEDYFEDESTWTADLSDGYCLVSTLILNRFRINSNDSMYGGGSGLGNGGSSLWYSCILDDGNITDNSISIEFRASYYGSNSATLYFKGGRRYRYFIYG